MKSIVQSMVVGVLLLVSVSPAFSQSTGKKWEEMNMEATRLLTQGKYDQALMVAKEALKTAEKTVGKNHLATAACLHTLGLVYYEKGIYDKAEPLFKSALAIREKALGPDHPDVAESLNALGELYKNQGQHAQSAPLFKRALAIREKTLGPSHPDVAESLDNVAWECIHGGDEKNAEAGRLYRRSLAIREKALKPDDPAIAESLSNVSLALQFQKKYKDAEPFEKRSLAIWEKTLGPDDPKLSSVLNNLAWVYYNQKKYGDAEPLFARVLAMKEKALGPDNPEIVFIVDNLAKLYEIEGRYAEAVPLFKRALALDEKESGPGGFNAATRTKNLAQLYRKMGRTRDAEALEKRAVTNGLLTAAKEENVDAVRAALDAGADVNVRQVSRGEKGNTPLHLAAERGQLQIVQLLIKKGAVVDARNNDMDTPLLLAADNNGTLEVVKYLVEHGADIQAKNSRGSTPLEQTSYDNMKYMQSLEKKLHGRNRHEVFGRVIKFKGMMFGNVGRNFGLGKTAEKFTLVINGKPTEIPLGTRLNESGFAAMVFPVDTMLTVGANKILFAKDEKIDVSYDAKTGNITTKIGVLAKDMTLLVSSLRIPFGAKRFGPEHARLHFHDNGAISEGYVSAKDLLLKVGANVITFKGNEIMQFDQDGGIIKGVMAGNAEVTVGKNKMTFHGGQGRFLATYPNGSIRSGKLAHDVALLVGNRTISFQKDRTISFFEDGSVESGTVNDEIATKVKGQNKILEKQKLYFNQDGSIEMIYEGYTYKKG